MLESRHGKQLFLAFGDLLVLVAAMFFSLLIRSGKLPTWPELSIHYLHFAPTFAGWILVHYIAGLYSPEHAFGVYPMTLRILGSSFIMVLGTALLFYLNAGVPITPKTVLAIFGIVSFGGMALWRQMASVIGRKALARTALGFVGWSHASADLFTVLRDEPFRGFDVIGAYARPDCELDLPPGVARLSIAELASTVKARNNGLLVIGDETNLPEEARATLFNLLGAPVRFMRLDDFYELVFRRVPIGIIDDLWFLENVNLVAKQSYEPFKRILDVVVSLIGLMVSLPFWPVIWLAVKAGSPGPLLFKQARLGRHGKVFTVLKFRTMRVTGNDFAPTAEGDPRITVAGRFLRSSRLDEIPQLLNILLGEMSFIGPRPERPELAQELAREIPFYNQRLLVKPGLSGWDQVSGEYHSPSVEDTYKKLQYDLYYLKNMSPLLDLSIFLKTIMTVLLRIGR